MTPPSAYLAKPEGIVWRIGERVRWLGKRAWIHAGGNEPGRVLIAVEGRDWVCSVRLDELEAAR